MRNNNIKGWGGGGNFFPGSQHKGRVTVSNKMFSSFFFLEMFVSGQR